MCDHAAVEQHALDLAVTPAMTKRSRMDLCDSRDIARRRVGDDRRPGRGKHIEQPSHHRRGKTDAVWGWASGARR
jgi:hypothetical protein